MTSWMLLPEQEYRKYPARYISTAHRSVTGRCNYRCKHCYMSAPNAEYGELSHETVMDIVGQLAECGVMKVSLTGGEALVRKDFWDIVDALLENDILITTIYSNGKLITESFLDELEKRNIRPEINMSYDGVGWHDWLRGVDGAEKYVEDAFIRCRDRGIPTGAEMCLHKHNTHTLRESVNRLHEWGCLSLKTNPVSDAGEWKENGYGAQLIYDELFKVYYDYIPQYYEDKMPLRLQLGDFLRQIRANPTNILFPPKRIVPTLTRFACAAMPDRLCIFPQKGVCSLVWHFPVWIKFKRIIRLYRR